MDELRRRLRERLARAAPEAKGEEAIRLAGVSARHQSLVRPAFPRSPIPAAVLLPIIDRPSGLSVLFTVRSDQLKEHAGQISLPGGRMEPGDADARATALRETEEEIGLQRRFVEILGELPDHLVISGYRVRPVVGLVRPGFQLQPDPLEVAETFEAPLEHLLDPAHHGARRRSLGEVEFDVYDIRWNGRSIWGATAGILMTLYGILRA